MKHSLVVILVVFLSLISFGATTKKTIIPDHEVLKTKNGVEVFYFPSPNIPLFEVKLVFDRGSDWDPKGKSGLSLFSSMMPKRGVPGLDENEISRRLDDWAAGIDASVSEEHITFSSFGLLDKAEPVLDLMFRQISSPTFPEAPFLRTKRNHLDNIAQLPDSPSSIASHVLDLLLFNGTPKARPGSGLRSEVAKLTLEDTKKMYPNIVRTDQLKVLVIGGQDKKSVLEKVVKRIEALPCEACGKNDESQSVWKFEKWRVPKDHVLVLERSGITEAHISMGILGPKRNIPEFYDLRVAETILSGHFASRMNEVIREKLNLSYAISAGFQFGKNIGTFTVQTSTKTQKTGELILQLNKLLKEFATGDATDEEIQMAKDFDVGSYPLGLQNIFVIADSYFSGLHSGLPHDFMDVYQDRVQAVTKESLKAAIQKYVRLDSLQMVVVGDPKILGPELTKAKIKYVVRKPQLYL